MPSHRNARPGCRAATIAALLLAAAGPLAAAITVDGTDYADATDFAGSLGLKPSWVEADRKLLLQSEWTQLELNAGSREVRLNGIRLLLGDATVLRGGALQLGVTDDRDFLGPILSARRVPGLVPAVRTVVIDAGHGGRDNGTSNKKLGLQEKGFALAVAIELKRLLEGTGFNVLLTRTDDTFVPLPDRPAFANSRRADLFVSIHFNAIENPSISGVETYVLTPGGQRSTGAERAQSSDSERFKGHSNNPWNAILGYRVHRRVVTDMKSFDRGLKRARFAVLRDLECPGILLEGGYLTNDAEARKIASAGWRARLAKAVADGIVEYRDVLDQARGK